MKRSSLRAWFVLLIAAAAGFAGYRAYGKWSQRREHAEALASLVTTEVHYLDLRPKIHAGGLVQASRQTIMRCQVERINIGNQVDLNPRGSTTILHLIADGSLVTRGESICKLDSSAYEEQLVQQEILVEESKSAAVQAKLDLEIAEQTLEEFRKGLATQTEREAESAVILARSQLQRLEEHMEWTRRMVKKGYSTQSQLKTEETNALSARITLERAEMALDVLKTHTERNYLRSLEVNVEKAKTNLQVQLDAYQIQKDRLENLQLQIKRCNVTAPHDGLLIYANRPERNFQIEEGLTVHQNQKLFFLPDLSSMEVEAPIHEAFIDHVHAGLPARIEIEALPNRILEGHVVMVSPVPQSDMVFFKGNDVKNYLSTIKIDTIPEGLRPGMTARVEIYGDTQSQALVIPSGAMRLEKGKHICYVVGETSVQRREVEIGVASEDFLQIKTGLAVGDEVLTDPSQIDDHRDLLASEAPPAASRPGMLAALLTFLPI